MSLTINAQIYIVYLMTKNMLEKFSPKTSSTKNISVIKSYTITVYRHAKDYILTNYEYLKFTMKNCWVN